MKNSCIIEPEEKRAVAFFDGQNLYHCAKAAYGHNDPNYEPNYDPSQLHDAICAEKGWKASSVRFYTGVPASRENPKLHRLWHNTLMAMRRRGIHTYSLPLQYHFDKTMQRTIGREKGIDVRIALDLVRLARQKQYDVAILFSQDQDLREAVKDVREISREEKRWIKLVSAFPYNPQNNRGINDCDWFRMDEAFFQKCLDSKYYWR